MLKRSAKSVMCDMADESGCGFLGWAVVRKEEACVD
jgi:hypothetical protein